VVTQGVATPGRRQVVGVGGTQHTVSASVEDRSHVNYPLLLEHDALQHYHVDVRMRAHENSDEDPEDEDPEDETEEEESDSEGDDAEGSGEE
jgi:hypothetical protein